MGTGPDTDTGMDALLIRNIIDHHCPYQTKTNITITIRDITTDSCTRLNEKHG